MDNSIGSIPQVPITIKRGGMFYLPLTYKASDNIVIPLTGYNARMQVWDSLLATGTSIIDIGSYGTNLAFGTISINPTTWQMAITIRSSFTITLPNVCTRGWFEFHLIDGYSNDIPLFEGPVDFEAGGLR